jgi:hypothetical protein
MLFSKKILSSGFRTVFKDNLLLLFIGNTVSRQKGSLVTGGLILIGGSRFTAGKDSQ